MNIKEVKAMSDDELRIKVAALCGWIHNRNAYFCHDLNAMHGAELYLQRVGGSVKWLDYVDNLRKLAVDWGGANAEISASARQRAEAFVFTMQEIQE